MRRIQRRGKERERETFSKIVNVQVHGHLSFLKNSEGSRRLCSNNLVVV